MISNPSPSLQYSNHTPIMIDGNAEFIDQANLEKWPGDGSQTTPYVIDGWQIEESSSILVEIRNTDLYFQINHCKLIGGGGWDNFENYGISLENVINGQILNNTISKSFYGIHLVDCSKITISGNVISDLSGNYGIYFGNSFNNIINSNQISESGEAAISLRFSGSNNVSTNIVINSEKHGIYLYSSNYNNISNNLIRDCPESGIRVSSSRNNNLVDNNLINDGIMIWGDLSDFIENEFVNNVVNGKPLVYWKNVVGGTVLTGAGEVILVNCSSVEVNNQNLSHTTVGLLAAYCDNLYIHDNNINNNSNSGILLKESFTNTIEHNTISHSRRIYGPSISSGYGIQVWDSERNKFENNIISNNAGPGIHLYCSRTNEINNNTFSNNGYGYGDECTEFSLEKSGNNTIVNNEFETGMLIRSILTYSPLNDFLQANVTNNWVKNRPLIFWQNKSGQSVPPNAGQVFLINCTNIEVTKLSLSHLEAGIFIAFGSQHFIHQNTISNSKDYGVFVVNSKDNQIADNFIFNNDTEWGDEMGIYLYNSNDSIIRNNTVESNDQYGILLYSCRSNLIEDNSVFDSSWGVALSYESKYNNISSNFINSNKRGIQLWTSSNNTITHNTLWYNRYSGMTLSSSSDNNTISLNDFIGNIYEWVGAPQASDDGTNNTFINNYWDDWIKPDTNKDAIVDIPYTIDGTSNNEDPFPMVFPQNNEHKLEELEVIWPNGGETVSDGISIRWKAAIDSFRHSINYSIFYSSDNGNTWIVISIGINMNEYWWDTTTINDGSAFLIKVVGVCSNGFTIEDVSDNTFTLDNVKSESSSPSSSFVPETTVSSKSDISPSWNIGLALFTLLMVLPWIRRKKKH